MGTIKVDGLGKAYRQYPSRWGRLKEWLLPWAGKRHTLKWVLQDISFSVRPGQALGIVGINGAGKSTLLKMIAGTVKPTLGRVKTEGRVAALLELGMGFHPEFTGRENAIMAGQLLGFTADQVRSLMPEIEAFAEIGDYIDQPVRVYSSGMQVRLAFSVATAVRPDILIVDEALSVGDVYFQHKSFDRIRQYRSEGTTLLFVSHDKGVIQSICDRALLISGGHLEMEGAPEAVMDFYNALLADRQGETVVRDVLTDGTVRTTSGTGEISLVSVAIYNTDGLKIEVCDVGARAKLEVALESTAELDDVTVGYMLKDRLGQEVFGTNTFLMQKAIDPLRMGQKFVVSFEFYANMGGGDYSISIASHGGVDHVGKNYLWCDRALMFTVINQTKPAFVGVNWMPPTIKVDYV